MRRLATLLAVPAALVVLAAPAIAQRNDSDRVADAREIARDLEASPVLESLPSVLGALTDALLDVRIGKLAAALEGDLTPSRRDSERTVADLGEENDPDFRERTEAQVRASAAGVAGMSRAIGAALPEIARSADAIEQEVARAARALPRPLDD